MAAQAPELSNQLQPQGPTAAGPAAQPHAAGLVVQQGLGKRAAEAALLCNRCGKQRKQSDLASEETAEQDEAPKEEQAEPAQNQQQPLAALSPADAAALVFTAISAATQAAGEDDGPMWLANVLDAAAAVRATGVELAISLTALMAQGVAWPEYVYPAVLSAHAAWTAVVAVIQAHRAAAAAADAAAAAAAQSAAAA
ncbi:hypothetical protein OEZ86_004267 [Tetradesmus obliquus]|nr:hypothetical protein OEZ86_004267 [Tetradesmus obliquus]